MAWPLPLALAVSSAELAERTEPLARCCRCGLGLRDLALRVIGEGEVAGEERGEEGGEKCVLRRGRWRESEVRCREELAMSSSSKPVSECDGSRASCCCSWMGRTEFGI